jgi:ubiquinone/menaquinone biosynthesis C-methylase UbiE
MSWWLAPYYDRLLKPAEDGPLGRWREELLADLSGRVLDLGAGTGANLPWYPATVEHLTLCEPDEGMASQLRDKLPEDPPFTIEVSSAPGECLPVDDASQDAVVCTLVLCTVGDLQQTLAEVRRVLKPGGRFVFLEHVAHESHRPLLMIQKAATPVWKLIAGGCCLDRRTGDAIADAGFDVGFQEFRTMPNKGVFYAPYLWGRARAPT